VAYTLLTGAQPSSVRAAILVLLVCASLLTGRPVSAFHCLAAAGLFILARNPADLFRIGPQLSFLAVGAICWFGPRWRVWMQRDGLTAALRQGTVWPLRVAAWLVRWWLRATLVTAVVWLVTLPLIMTQFHLVSPVAIVLSPVVGLPIAVALLCGFGVLLLGWLAPPLAYVAARLCDASLGVIDLLVTQAATWPGSHFWVAGPPVWWLLGFYGGLLAWAAAGALRPAPRYALAMLGMWMAVGFAVRWWQTRPADEVQCAFLAVGHGCCIVVHLPEGRTLLYDVGSLAAPHRAARVAGGYFWHCGVRQIDVLVVSHNDVDHYNGVPDLLEQFPVGQLWTTPGMLDDPSAATRVLRDAVQQAGIEVCAVSAGHEVQFGGCRIRVLHPPPAGVPGSDNANSLVLLLEYAGHRVLLTGDLEPPGLGDLLRAPPLACDVILAPHHGSARSDPPGLAAWCRPRWVVISGGDHREAQSVVQTYQQLGAEVWHTDRHGAVFVRCRRDGVEVRSFRTSP
jgi:competence protein ComEC